MEKQVNHMNMKKIRIGRIMVLIIMIILLLNQVTSKSDKLFEIIGFRVYTVLSGSMEPKFYTGDIVIIKHKSKSNIQVNDVITFMDTQEEIITHRIIEQTSEGYITKGDNNNAQDINIVTEEDIIGEVMFSIPKIGYTISFLSKDVVIAGEMILLSIIIFMYSYKSN